MRSRVYVETSIPSFYYEVRTEPDMIARRDWTRQFWSLAESEYELVTSVAVLEELERGNFPNKVDVIALAASLPILPLETSVGKIVDTYIANRIMPADPRGDALHLALASFNECEFLLTWNCKHLANANKFGHIRRINDMLGLKVPLLVTPYEFLGESI